MDSLLEELQCPICTDYLTIPIRQCATGHSVCGKCIEKLEKCALCRNDFTDSRNLTLEQLALKIKYPCVNKEAGCKDTLSYTDREKHELHCKFKGFQTTCPLKGCDFVGDPVFMKSHWLAKKSSSKIYQTVQSSSTKLKNDSYFVTLAEGYGELFWFKTKTFNNNMYFAMQLLGKPEKSGKFYFEIEFNKSGSRKKIILGDNCKSIELNDKTLLNDDSCALIGFGALSQFLVNDYLNYTLRLCKDDGNKGFKQKNAAPNNTKQTGGQNQGQNKTKKQHGGDKQQKSHPKPGPNK